MIFVRPGEIGCVGGCHGGRKFCVRHVENVRKRDGVFSGWAPWLDPQAGSGASSLALLSPIARLVADPRDTQCRRGLARTQSQPKISGTGDSGPVSGERTAVPGDWVGTLWGKCENLVARASCRAKILCPHRKVSARKSFIPRTCTHRKRRQTLPGTGKPERTARSSRGVPLTLT